MKKTALILMLTSVMSIALNTEIAAEYKLFEDAIRKNNPDTLRALASVYQEKKLPLPMHVKAHLVAAASKEMLHQQAIKPRIFFPDKRSADALFLTTAQCCGFLVTMYKTFWPNDQNLPHGWAALKDPSNARLVAVMSGITICGIVLTKIIYDGRNREMIAQEQENSAALRNATEVHNILQEFPTTA